MSRVTHLLVHRADWQRNQATEAGGGVFPEDFVSLDASLPVRVWAMTGKDVVLAQQLRVEASHVAYAEPGTALRLDDRLELGAAYGDLAGTYRVRALLPPSLPHHLKALCERIQTGVAA